MKKVLLILGILLSIVGCDMDQQYQENQRTLQVGATLAKNQPTPTAYNEYMLKNSFQWQNNIPSDIYMELKVIE